MKNMTIYILDDNQDMLDMLNDMAEDIGLHVQCFSSGKRFFEHIVSFEENSLMVLDLSMPEMDGIEVMRRLATMLNPPQLILISGHDIGVLHSAVKLGVEHQLKIISSLDKPIQLDSFQKLLLKFCVSSVGFKNIKQEFIQCALLPETLLAAIRNDELVLHYQPQIEISSGQLMSCEALVRWQHPELGLIYPDYFIELAEVNGLMEELTSWVLNKAVEQGSQWMRLNLAIPISINVSANNISSLLLPEQISDLLNNHMLKPEMITLEVTESTLMGELVTSLDTLTRLRLKGIGLSIDDFGTGYSSLSKLHKIPFTELKIDKSFVISMLEDDDAKAIVKTCVMLGHELNMTVVAEGVESKAHLDILSKLGCDIAQGYYFSKPVPAAEMLIYMTRDKTSTE